MNRPAENHFQLTVHHKDHNHDSEHQRYLMADASGETPPSRAQDPPSTFTPFAQLADLLKRKQAAS